MDKFTIITNSIKDPSRSVTNRIADYLLSHKKECLILEAEEKKLKQPYYYTDVSKIPDDMQCVIVLGGDGTLLQAARDVIDKQIPLVGINLGTLGYLAEIDQHSIYSALDRLMSDLYTIENRMMLHGMILRDGKVIAEDLERVNRMKSTFMPGKKIAAISGAVGTYFNAAQAQQLKKQK